MTTEAKGSEGRILLDDDAVTLIFEGALTQAVKKRASPRRIPLTAVEAVEFVERKGMRPGYLRLHLVGAAESEKYRPAHDVDTLVWSSEKHKEPLAAIARAVAQHTATVPRVRDNSLLPPPGPSAPPAASAGGRTADADEGGADPGGAVRPDVAAVVARMGGTLGAKRELRKLPERLWEGEVVERMASGRYAGKTGLVVLTDRRLLFLADGWLSARMEDFPIDKISSVQSNTGLVLGTLTIFASGNKAEIGGLTKEECKAIGDALRARISGSPPASVAAAVAAPTPAGAPQPDVLDQLRKLGELRDAGVLTEEEFAAKKSALLDRL